jgi:gliding motility-associated-like protein
MKKYPLIILLFLFTATTTHIFGQGDFCSQAEPFCSDNGSSFPAGVNSGTAEAGPNYGCLGTQPNPAWYYLQVDQSGDIQITMSNSANEDIDYILWGPFSDPSSPCTAQLTSGNIVDCSYSTTATEVAYIPNAQSGEVYIMLITNFSNNNTNIFVNQTGGSGSTDCSIVDINCANNSGLEGESLYNGTEFGDSDFPLSVTCEDTLVLFPLNRTDGGGYFFPVLEFIINTGPNTNTGNYTATILMNGTPIYNNPDVGANTQLTVYPTGPFFSPSDDLEIEICDNSASQDIGFSVVDPIAGETVASDVLTVGNCQTFGPFNAQGTGIFSGNGIINANPGDWGAAFFIANDAEFGTNTITYCFDHPNPANPNCVGCIERDIIVTNPFNPTWNNPGPFCENDDDVDLNDFLDPSATPGGTWSGDGVSGSIFSPTQVGTGSHSVTYTVGINANCADSLTLAIEISPIADASFEYDMLSICFSSTNNPIATITGDQGGVFSINNNGVIDPTTGEIDVQASGIGTFVVTYSISGDCPDSESVTITISDSPDAEFSYPQDTYCLSDDNPEVVLAPGAGMGEFSAVPAGLAIDPNTGTINLANSTPNTYTITNFIDATDACPESSFDFELTIAENDDPSFSYSTGVLCSGGSSITPSITGSQGGTFSESSGNLDINPQTGEVNPGNSTIGGPYTIVYTTSGICPDSSEFEIEIIEELEIIIDPIAPLCVYDTPVTLTANEAGGTWSGQGVTDNGDGTGTFDPSIGSDLYEITYEIFGDCPSSGSTTIEVIPTNIAVITSSSGLIFCVSEDPVQLSGNDSNGSWDFSGNGIVDNGNGTLTFSPSLAGVGSHVISFTTSGSCPDTEDVTIEVIDLPNSPFVQSDTFCLNIDNIILIDINQSGLLNWYDENGNFLETSAEYSPSIANPGIYTYCVTQTQNGCESLPYCFQIYVGNPIASFDLESDVGNMPFSINITNNSSNANSYSWDFGNGDESSDFEPVYTYNNWGEFIISLLVSDEYGCEDEFSLTVTVDATSSVTVPNVFTPNGDGINDEFRLIGQHLSEVSAQIFNRWGQLIYEWNTPQGGWDGRSNSGIEVPEGVYYYKILAKGIDGQEYEFVGNVTLVR